MDRIKAALHPVRERILTLFSSGDRAPLEIVECLGDVPTGSVYRHIKVLQDAGLIEIVSRKQIGGAVTNIYGLPRKASLLTPEERASIDPESFLALSGFFVRQIKHHSELLAKSGRKPLVDDTLSMFARNVLLTDEEIAEIRRIMTNAYYASDRARDPSLRKRFVAFFSFPEDPIEASSDADSTAEKQKSPPF